MANSNYQKGQFLIVPNKAIVLKLRGAALNVYLAIVDHADDNGKCFPSFNRLADVTGYNRRQCMRAMDDLEKTGLIKRTNRTLPVRGKTSNTYQLQVIHTPSDIHVTSASDTHVTSPSDIHVTSKLYPLELNPFNSKDLSFEQKKAYAKACEQDRALARREVRRASPSNKGSFGSVADIVSSPKYGVQTGI